MSSIRDLVGAAAPGWSRAMSAPIRRLLLLSRDEASCLRRGFVASDPVKQGTIQGIGETFIVGYNAALQADAARDVFALISAMPPDRRGFAAEGAAMGFAVADALPFRGSRLPDYLAAADARFAYLVHVGAGWAMARLPWRRARIWAQLDPLLCWLAYDGMGFHDAYFTFSRVKSGWRRAPTGYRARAYDQGIGRALWFVAVGEIEAALRLLSEFPSRRQPDLWSGLGLAMAYAGAADAREVTTASDIAGPHRAHFAQGVAFACEAHALGRNLPSHADACASVLTGRDAATLAAMVRQARPGAAPADHDATPAYENWRRDVATAMNRLMENRR
jgi:hypothetical protein